MPVALYASSTSEAAQEVAACRESQNHNVYSAGLSLLNVFDSEQIDEEEVPHGSGRIPQRKLQRVLPALLTNPSPDLLVRAPQLGSTGTSSAEGDYVLVFPGNHKKKAGQVPGESTMKDAAAIMADAKPGDYSVARALHVSAMENLRKGRASHEHAGTKAAQC